MAGLKQLKCPSCGAILNQSFPNQLIVECPYCHQQVVNEIFQSSRNDNEPHVLEFSMKEEDVVKTMVNMLVEDPCVPTDIFDKMKITSITKYYVPMYIFEGTFRAPWTAVRPREEKRQRIGSDGKIEDYYETLYDYFNGEAAGNFSVNGIPSNEISILDLNSDAIQKIIVNPSKLSLFSKLQFNSNDNIEVLTPSKDSNSVWWESGESIANDIGASCARNQAAGNVTSCSASCELKKTSFVYIPLWYIKYKYNSDFFNAIYYAEQYLDNNHPIGELIVAQPTEEEIKILNSEKEKSENFDTGMGCIFLFVVSLFGIPIVGDIFDISFFKTISVAISDKGGLFWVIGLVLVFFLLNSYFNTSDGSKIDKIKKDIERRTQFLRNQEENILNIDNQLVMC